MQVGMCGYTGVWWVEERVMHKMYNAREMARWQDGKIARCYLLSQQRPRVGICTLEWYLDMGKVIREVQLEGLRECRRRQV